MSSNYWTTLVYSGEVLCHGILVRLQIIAVYSFVSVRMQRVANEIGELGEEAKRSPAAVCHKAIKLCTILDNDPSEIVRKTQLEFCVRLLTESPMKTVTIFDHFEDYIFCDSLTNSYTLLLAVLGEDDLHRPSSERGTHLTCIRVIGHPQAYEMVKM